MTETQQPDAYLAKPPAQCCLTGSLHVGEPRGSIETIEGVDTYISKPKNGSGYGNIIFYFPDVWGLHKNGCLMMDGFADAGYTVFGIDYFRGDPVWKHRKDKSDTTTDPSFDFEAWKSKHTSFAFEVVPKWVPAVKEKYGSASTKFACVGYCFGAPFVCNELAGDTCSAGAFAHPAFLKEQHFYDLKKPLLLSCAEIDHTFPNESRNKAVDILNAEKKRYQLQLFQGVAHGFAVRCNLDNAYEKFVKEQSFKGIVDFFDFWLSQE